MAGWLGRRERVFRGGRWGGRGLSLWIGSLLALCCCGVMDSVWEGFGEEVRGLLNDGRE